METILNQSFLNNLWQELKNREPKEAVVELTDEIIVIIKDIMKELVSDLVKTKNVNQVLPLLKQHLPNFFKEVEPKLLEEVKNFNNLRDVILVVINAVIIEIYRILHILYELFTHKLTSEAIYNYIHLNSNKIMPFLQDILHKESFNKLFSHFTKSSETGGKKTGAFNIADFLVPTVTVALTVLEEKVKASRHKYGQFMSKHYQENWDDEYSEFMKSNKNTHWKEGFKMFMTEKHPDWKEKYSFYKQATENKLPYYGNLESETLNNSYYRHVIYTSATLQIVLMSIKPTQEIGMEIHPTTDQFVRVEKGNVKVILGSEGNFEHCLKDGDAIVVPANTYHNFVNIGQGDVKLYTIYSPPEHEAGLIEKYKSKEDMKSGREYKARQNMFHNSILGPIISWFEEGQKIDIK